MKVDFSDLSIVDFEIEGVRGSIMFWLDPEREWTEDYIQERVRGMFLSIECYVNDKREEK